MNCHTIMDYAYLMKKGKLQIPEGGPLKCLKIMVTMDYVYLLKKGKLKIPEGGHIWIPPKVDWYLLVQVMWWGLS